MSGRGCIAQALVILFILVVSSSPAFAGNDHTTGVAASWSDQNTGQVSGVYQPLSNDTAAISAILAGAGIRLKENPSVGVMAEGEPGILPGVFDRYQIGRNDGMSPSLAIDPLRNKTHFTYFVLDPTNGNNGYHLYGSLDFSNGDIRILKDSQTYGENLGEPRGDGSYTFWDWVQSSVAVNTDGFPQIAFLVLNDDGYYYLAYAWPVDENNWNYVQQNTNQPASPALTILGDKKPAVGFASQERGNPGFGFCPGDPPYKLDDPSSFVWGLIFYDDSASGSPIQMTDYNLLYADRTGTTHALYYNKSKNSIRHYSTQTPYIPDSWKGEDVQTAANSGWMRAAYDPDMNTLGVCWYDQAAKKLQFKEKNLTGTTWGNTETVDQSGNNTGMSCSLGYGNISGILPGPGISFLDMTANTLEFAWKENGTWYHQTVESDILDPAQDHLGTSCSIGYGSAGEPHIIYRQEKDRQLKYAHLKSGNGSINASFTSNTTSGTIPLTVQFQQTTWNNTISALQDTGAFANLSIADHYWWDLNGDGKWEQEDVKEPVFTYYEPGSYDVRMLMQLEITYDLGPVKQKMYFWGLADMPNYITAYTPDPLSARFNASPTFGSPPLCVQFTDTSSGYPGSWQWAFGDGTFSREQNPIHTYNGLGRYTVTLEVANLTNGSSITRVPACIDVNAGPMTGQSGMVQVRSSPSGAAIQLDRQPAGVTPVDQLIARTGNRSLQLQLGGYRDWNSTVYVPAGDLRIIPTTRLIRA